MVSHRIYYSLKPYLPWRVRIGVRRMFARRLRREHRATWPIQQGASLPPDGWPGWPDGKKFALVLTHDVEDVGGLEKTRLLAEHERELGFRSTFNFIPEGPYRVPADLRVWLRGHGFEVGVHDLRHDGWLFESKAAFEEHAKRINTYLRDWGACGFRSGFMLRNLDWLQQLDVQYDASTFDTDPFEMQSDGAGTIFPYWVPSNPANHKTGGACAGRRGGYLELPYTLPQDSTLFLLLRERGPEIWLRKLDWIAEHGGMALVNVHPDYLQFEGHEPLPRTFPIGHYLELLNYARRRYGNTFWQPVAGELAEYARRFKPRLRSDRPASVPTIVSLPSAEIPELTPVPSLRGKRAAVLLYSYYPSDPRPRRAAEALAQEGVAVELICLRESEHEPVRESINGVNVRRLPMGKTRAGKLAYFWQYGRFIATSFAVLAWRSLRGRYDLVHVHNMPDILVFAALPARLRGARLVLDLHDPMPELMTSIYGLTPKHWLVSLLRSMERRSIAFVDRVITVNLACRKIFGGRSCPADKIEVVMNAPDETIFGFRPVENLRRSSTRLVIMYHGSIVERHGLDLAIEALAKIRPTHPGAELRIYGKSNPYLEQVLAQADKLGLSDVVHHLGATDHAGIARAIDECDIGIIPNRRSIFTEINTPTRIFEYLARGKPVIAPNAPGITDYFGADELVYFELGDAEDLARQLAFVADHPDAVTEIVRRGQRVYQRHEWSCERSHFLAVVDRLITPDSEESIAQPVPAER